MEVVDVALAAVRAAAGEAVEEVRSRLSAKLEQQAAELEGERQERRRLEMEVLQLRKQLLCTICFERERSVAIQPCFHLASCALCEDRLRACPVCRMPSLGRLRILLC